VHAGLDLTLFPQLMQGNRDKGQERYAGSNALGSGGSSSGGSSGSGSSSGSSSSSSSGSDGSRSSSDGSLPGVPLHTGVQIPVIGPDGKPNNATTFELLNEPVPEVRWAGWSSNIINRRGVWDNATPSVLYTQAHRLTG